MLAQKLSEILYTGKRQPVHVDCFGGLHPFESLRRNGKTSDSSNKLQGPSPLRPGSEYFLFCRFFCRILPLKSWPRSTVKFYIRANDSQFASTDLAVFVHLSHFKTTTRRPIQAPNYRGRVPRRPGSEYFLFCRFFCRILQLKSWPRSSVKFYIRANDSQFTSTDLAVFVHFSHFKTTVRRPIQVTNFRGRVPLGHGPNIFCFAVPFVE